LAIRFFGRIANKGSCLEVMKMANENAQLVPLVKLSGKEFLVDIDNREFVDKNDLNHCIDMHSKQGHSMVNKMLGMEWRCYAVYPDKRDKLEV